MLLYSSWACFDLLASVTFELKKTNTTRTAQNTTSITFIEVFDFMISNFVYYYERKPNHLVSFWCHTIVIIVNSNKLKIAVMTYTLFLARFMMYIIWAYFDASIIQYLYFILLPNVKYKLPVVPYRFIFACVEIIFLTII